MLRLYIMSLLTVVASPVIAHERQSGLLARQIPEKGKASTKEDIVIVGRAPDDDRGVDYNSVIPVAGPVIAEFDDRSQMFARCAKKVNMRWLRVIIDGEPNSASATLALDRAIRTNIGCYSSVSPTPPAEPYLGECNAFLVTPGIRQCRASYDRGALFVEAIKRYAPDATLTRAETSNPIIQQRLRTVEVTRNRKRFKFDRQYFQAVLCMVAVEPELATQIAHQTTDGITRAGLVRRLVARSTTCLGNPVKYKYEAVEMRNYIVEAFYRWVIASRNLSSLLPSQQS